MFLIVLFIKILTLHIFVMFYQWDKALLPSENCFRLAVIGWMAWRSFWKSLAERSWESGVKAPKGRAWPFLHLGSWEMYFAALSPPHPHPTPPPPPPPGATLSGNEGLLLLFSRAFGKCSSWALCSQRLFRSGKAQPPPFLSVWEVSYPCAPATPPRFSGLSVVLVTTWPAVLVRRGRGRRRKPRIGEQKCGIPLLSSLACQAALLLLSVRYMASCWLSVPLLASSVRLREIWSLLIRVVIRFKWDHTCQQLRILAAPRVGFCYWCSSFPRSIVLTGCPREDTQERWRGLSVRRQLLPSFDWSLSLGSTESPRASASECPLQFIQETWDEHSHSVPPHRFHRPSWIRKGGKGRTSCLLRA